MKNNICNVFAPIANKLRKPLNRIRNKVSKHSPEILVIGGVCSMLVGTGLAVKASLDVKDVLSDAADEINLIHDDEDILDNPDDRKIVAKDKAKVYCHYGVKLVRMYAPSAIFLIGGTTAVFSGHNILKNRNAALASAYATLDSAYSSYRQRVKDAVGDEKEQRIAYSLTDEKVKDDNGKKKTVTYADTENGLSMYAMPIKAQYEVLKAGQDPNDLNSYYTVKNPYFESDEMYLLSYLKTRELFMNLQLEERGRVYLSDVYKELGIVPPDTDHELASRVVGWVDHGDIHQINFFSYAPDGVDIYENPEYLIRDHDGNMILDFNVEGNVIDRL